MSVSLAKKITPFDLSQPKIKIAVENLIYSHESQTVLKDSTPIDMATTWGATQTFDSQGRPKDKDNDK